MNLKDLTRHNTKSIREAGPRYTPGLDPNAPNIKIDHLVEAMDTLSLTNGFRTRVSDLRDELESAYDQNKYALGKAFRRRSVTPRTMIEDAGYLSSLVRPFAIQTHTSKVLRHSKLVSGALEAEVSRIAEAEADLRRQQDGDQESEESRELGNRRFQISRLQSSVRALRLFLSDVGRLAGTPRPILIVGSWGTGKTHLMCDVADHQLDGSVPALLFLASTVDAADNVLDAMAASSGLARSGNELLSNLNSLGAAAGRRALLLIDGINEGDAKTWRRSLTPIAREVARFKHLGLVVTCRRPYEQQLLSRSAGKRFLEIEHWGFADQEFDVQLEFFNYYGLEAPEVPLITTEFSNPLFLGLFCKAIRDLRSRTQKQKLREIASGQKAMTYIFEYFAKRVGKPVEVEYDLPGKSCWGLLKLFAEAAVEKSSSRLLFDDAVDVVASQHGLTRARARSLIERMSAEGLLIKQMHWRDDTPTEVVHFPFERFGDHLIARYLLQKDLNTSSDEAVRRSFYVNRPLGQIFELEQWRNQFASPGLAEALMVEFPERVKGASIASSELVRYLPKKSRFAAPLAQPFLDGLYWRSASSFDGDTDDLVGFLLGLDSERIQHQTLDALVGLAARPGHPYSASRLERYLEQFTMPERDLLWSEYLRLCEDASPFHRVVAWADKSGSVPRRDEAISNDIKLLSLGLTTTVRPLRDQITQALVRLGCRSPRSLFAETAHSLDWNDPYVPERLLAASYGAAMKLWADPAGTNLQEELVPFARQLARFIFSPDSRHATAHTLMQGYAEGVIELALKVQPRSISTQHLHFVRSLRISIKSPFTSASRIDEASVEKDRRALRMDFDNYTIGRLIPNRQNYDDSNTEFQDVRKQIVRRMQDLGYSADLFDPIDDQIGGYNWRASDDGKTDRYGKKYSWIAYFEMYGYRLAHDCLDEWRSARRTPDCDVDPSFPSAPREWKPDLPDPFTGEPRGRIQWLREGSDPKYDDLFLLEEADGHEGSWVLLDGHINQEGSYNRHAFAFLQAVLINKRDIPRLLEYVEAKEYLGNQSIPTSGDDDYTYAGEIPWSKRFGDGNRLARGGARRHLEPVYHWHDGDTWRSSLIVEVPAHSWTWESHHSPLNTVSGVEFPAPALCEALELVNHDGTFDLFDDQGRLAAIYREWPPERDSNFRSRVLYLREDLLRKYLTQTNQSLVWIPWGERDLSMSTRWYERPTPSISSALQERANVHRRFVIYTPEAPDPLAVAFPRE